MKPREFFNVKGKKKCATQNKDRAKSLKEDDRIVHLDTLKKVIQTFYFMDHKEILGDGFRSPQFLVSRFDPSQTGHHAEQHMRDIKRRRWVKKVNKFTTSIIITMLGVAEAAGLYKGLL